MFNLSTGIKIFHLYNRQLLEGKLSLASTPSSKICSNAVGCRDIKSFCCIVSNHGRLTWVDTFWCLLVPLHTKGEFYLLKLTFLYKMNFGDDLQFILQNGDALTLYLTILTINDPEKQAF